MDDLTIILNSLYEKNDYLNRLENINILEIGTGNGANSTRIIYDFFIKKKYKIQTYII